MGTPALSMRQVGMIFPQPGNPGRRVLTDIDLDLEKGCSLALAGRSGSGKTTLLHLAAGIAVPTSGRVCIGGRDLADMGEAARSHLRQQVVGLIFQFFHLLPHLNVTENVALAGWIAGRQGRELDRRVSALLDMVGLHERRHDPVAQLSGGEQQRVAICRALVNNPSLLLADEPTGSLDDRTGAEILALLLDLSRREDCALLLVTHSRELAALTGKRLLLHDGHLVADQDDQR